MAAAETSALPIEETVTPSDQTELAEAVAAAYAQERAVYPLGGETSLDFGLPAKTPGLGLSTKSLTQIVDYPARDMTITLESGVTMSTLLQTLAKEGQRLPIDVPQSEQATLGGMVATNISGPRRFGHGTLRDFIIGISAVDGRGKLFKAGGRVVKNVAGYDFCKLLTGSLGTLGVITQLTLKVKPIPEQSVLLSTEVNNAEHAELLLSNLITSQTTPTSINLLQGPAWEKQERVSPGGAALVVGLEGTTDEVSWMVEQLKQEWQAFPEASEIKVNEGAQTGSLWSEMTEFPAAGESPLVLHASVRPSRVVDFCQLVQSCRLPCSILAHAGSGILTLRFEEFDPGDVSSVLIRQLQPATQQRDGDVTVWRADSSLGDLPRQAVWGNRDSTVNVMEAIRAQFDPAGILNPGRFLY